MKRSYRLADDKTIQLVSQVMNESHKHLAEVGVRFQIVMSEAMDRDGNIVYSLSKDGIYCAAKIGLHNKKNRIIKNIDIEITIDSLYWQNASIEERKSTIDHELTHIVVKLDKEGLPKVDDDGLVCFKMRRHDLVYWGFKEILERNKTNSIEYQSFKNLLKDIGGMVTPPTPTPTPIASPEQESQTSLN